MSHVMVRCEQCSNSWKLTGNWSPLVRETLESKPCPKCGADALCCPEPVAGKRPRGRRKPTEPRVTGKPG